MNNKSLLTTLRTLGRKARQGRATPTEIATLEDAERALAATRPAPKPVRGIWDLEVFKACWEADARDLGR